MRTLFSTAFIILILAMLATAQTPAKPKSLPASSSPKPSTKAAAARKATAPKRAQVPDLFKALQERFDHAAQFEQQGDLIRAESDYRYVLGVSLERLGAVFAKLGEQDKAIDVYGAASRARANSVPALMGLGTACLQKGEYEKGIEAAQMALSISGGDPAVRALLGRLYLASNRPDAALIELQEAHRALPQDTDTWLAVARAYLALKRPERAAEVFAEIQNHFGDSARLHILFGLAYRQFEFYDAAIEQLRRAVKMDPQYPGGHYYLGLALISQQGTRDTAAAIHEFREALQRRPDDYLSNYMLGLVLLDERRYAEAVPCFENAVAQGSDKPDPFLYLGQALFLSGKQEKAIPLLEHAIEISKDPSRNGYQISKAHYVLGQYLNRHGKPEEARKHLALAAEYNRRSVQMNQKEMSKYMGGMGGPDNVKRAADDGGQPRAEATITVPLPPEERTALQAAESTFATIVGDAYNRLGLLKARQEDFRNASAFLEQAARWTPGLSDIFFNLGLAAFKAANYPVAVQALERDVAARPDRKETPYLLGLSYFFTTDYAKAGPQLTKAALGGQADDPQLMYALGLCHAYAGDRSLGKKILASLIEKQPKSAEAHVAMGRALALDGDFGPALDEFSKALEFDPNAADAHYYKGLALIRLSRNAEAAAELRVELKRNPNSARAAFHLGYALSSTGDVEAALAAFQSAATLDPSYANAYYEIGKIRVRQGQYQPAIEALQKAVQLGAENSFVYYQLGQAYQRSGNTEQAQVAVARYRELKAAEQAARPATRMIEPEQK